MPLNDMASVVKNKNVDHEVFGRFLVERRPDIADTLRGDDFDPEEISKIFTGETGANDLYSQLIHSTLDADRLDYLLRDSHYAGVPYGHIDLNFILSQLIYCPTERVIAVAHKGIPALEHYLIGRYFTYNNVTYHKTIVGFETVAQALYYQMFKEGKVIGDLSSLTKVALGDWLPQFDDSYFWGSMRTWISDDEYFRDLKESFTDRRPLCVLCEERKLVPFDNTDSHFLLNPQLPYNQRFQALLDQYGIQRDCIALIRRVRSKPALQDYPLIFFSKNSNTSAVFIRVCSMLSRSRSVIVSS